MERKTPDEMEAWDKALRANIGGHAAPLETPCFQPLATQTAKTQISWAMLATKRVFSADDVSKTASLAREIWTEHFTPIIGGAQVEYMLRTIQSPSAIAQQIRDGGYEYWLAMDDDSLVGYFATVPDVKAEATQLSKLYLKRDQRRRGLGRAMIRLVEERCDALGVARLWLTVNKDNATAIEFYERAGFATEASIVTDIGRGFVMDDYRMVKVVGSGFRGQGRK